MDATVLVAQKNGMYKNTEMCKDCLSKWPLWLDHVVRRRFLEPRYRQKYLGSRETTLRLRALVLISEFRKFRIQVKRKKLKNSACENCLTVISSGRNKIFSVVFVAMCKLFINKIIYLNFLIIYFIPYYYTVFNAAKNSWT